MRVGFVGLGTQGKPLARNVATAGHDLVVYDIRREPLDELAAAGARIAKSPREVGAHSEIVQVCVVDDRQVDDVMLGPDGILAGAQPGTIVAVHSTVSPATMIRVADIAADVGVVLIDAPVSGGEQGAINRSMSYILGGNPSAISRCEPILALSGNKIARTGPVGTATIAKLAHQVVACANILAIAEGMRLGLRAGLARDVLLQVIHDGFAQSRVGDMWADLDLAPRATPLFYKDLTSALDLARSLDLELPGTAMIRQHLDELLPRATGGDRR